MLFSAKESGDKKELEKVERDIEIIRQRKEKVDQEVLELLSSEEKEKGKRLRELSTTLEELETYENELVEKRDKLRASKEHYEKIVESLQKEDGELDEDVAWMLERVREKISLVEHSLIEIVNMFDEEKAD